MLPVNITKTLAENKPAIKLAGATVMAFGSTAWAIYITPRAIKEKEIFDKVRAEIETRSAIPSYTEEMKRKDIINLYIKFAGKMALYYSPCLAMLLSAAGLNYSGGKDYANRTAAATAFGTAAMNEFNAYREEVAKRYGREIENDIYNYNTTTTEPVVDETTGEVNDILKDVKIPNNHMYTILFDESSCFFWRDPQHNLAELKGLEASANAKLHARGYLTWNELLKHLGFEPFAPGETGSLTPQYPKWGQIVGWDMSNHAHETGNIIDFGLHNLYDEDSPIRMTFFKGIEPTFPICLKPDGVIFNNFKD